MNYKSNIRKLYAFTFFRNVFFLAGILVPFFTDWGGVSFFQLTLLQSWFVLWVTLLEVPTGAVADFLGRKISIFFGSLMIMGAVFAYTFEPNFYLFLLGEFLWALSYALVSGADQALVYDTLKEAGKEKDSKKIIGRYNSAHLLGLVVAAPLGSFIAGKFGLRIAVISMVIPFFISAIIALTIEEPNYRTKKESLRYVEQLTKGIKYFYKHKNLRILAFDAISVGALSFFIVWLNQPILLELGLALSTLGLIHATGTFSEVVISSNFSKLENLLGSKKNYALWTAIFIGVSFILLSLSSNLMLSIIFTIIIFGFGFTRPVLFNNYMNKYIASGSRATVLSTVSMVNNFTKALFYPLIGLLMEYSLNFTALVIGILIILCTMMIVNFMHLLEIKKILLI